MTSVEKLFFCGLWNWDNQEKKKRERVNQPPPQGDKIGIYNGKYINLLIWKRTSEESKVK